MFGKNPPSKRPKTNMLVALFKKVKNNRLLALRLPLAAARRASRPPSNTPPALAVVNSRDLITRTQALFHYFHMLSAGACFLSVFCFLKKNEFGAMVVASFLQLFQNASVA